MRIGIVLYPTYGGSGVVATELGKALANKGHNVHFITYSQPVKLNQFMENISYHEVSVSEYPLFDYAPYETVLASKMVDVVKHEKLDVLHVHYAIPHASAAFMAKEILHSQGIYIPFVTTLHGTDITLVGRSPSFEPVISFCINKSDAVTSVSESLKKDTYEHFSTKREIDVVPNFVKVPSSIVKTENPLRCKYAKRDEPIITHISNFRPVKRVGDVLDVFEKINEKIKSKLILVGDGPDRYKLEEKCRIMDLCDRVKFIGKVRDTSEVLEIADLFILPSETESFGLAALEAMAMGVPVISSNTGGIPEVNLHGVTGFLSDVRDTESMAAHAISLLSDKDSLEEFRNNAVNRARKFNIESSIGQYEEIYKRVLNIGK